MRSTPGEARGDGRVPAEVLGKMGQVWDEGLWYGR